MENTLENKERFFAQYFGQKVLNYGLKDLVLLSFAFMTPQDIEDNLLELKSVSLITDQDAEGYLHFIGCHSFGDRIKQSKEQIQEDCHNDIHMSDYLRSKGYALPWMGLSIEKQIEFGWIKLI